MNSISEKQKELLQSRINSLQKIVDNIGVSTPIDIVCALGASCSSLDRIISNIEKQIKE